MKSIHQISCTILLCLALLGCSRKEAQPEEPLADLVFPLGNGINADAFRANILGENLFLREGEKGVSNAFQVGFVLDEQTGQPTRVFSRGGVRADDLSFSLMLFLPTIDYRDYTLENLKRLVSIGNKKLGTPDLATVDWSQPRDSFLLGFASPRLYGDNRILYSKGQQAPDALQILFVRDIPADPLLGPGVEVRARINCTLYTGDAEMGQLKNGEFVLKFYLTPYRKP